MGANMTETKPRPPAHLKPETRAWWAHVHETHELEEHHTRLLTAAAEAWDRMQAARAAIDQHGLTYLDGAGRPHARPEVSIERDARIGFARLVRELDLDGGSPEPPRPPLPPRTRR